MNLVDVHCHLNHALFKDDIDSVIQRAKDAGVKSIIVSGTNTESNKQVLELVKHDPILNISLGIHPIDALGLSEGETGIPKQLKPINIEEEFKFIEKNKSKILAIGEVGMDFHWDKTHHAEQKEIFRKVCTFAVRIKKPIIVHAWEAEEECLDILEAEINGKVPVILHCFGGRKALITRGKELGYYFTVPPSILKSSNFQTLVKKVNLHQLLTETDAPWQSPLKDTKNEPSFVAKTIQKIAEIKGLSVQETAEKIWENYTDVFLSHLNKHL
ncbi:hypothetical protein COV17_02385 [Candidatus Woesearchaeota archaeon CG10_big_fil_rev_8_21_14_0_10_36_11]|nr:MAG: hypothetical protein COV17_02385 [Candidatus Woesearchaeota archaeon CG10_big_fil_rev_8_21_14_0_10_36_11]